MLVSNFQQDRMKGFKVTVLFDILICILLVIQIVYFEASQKSAISNLANHIHN